MQTLTLLNGDCVQRMAEMPDNSVGAIVCDPPYGLRFMQTKERTWDDLGDGASQREWHAAWLREAYRILQPSGFLLAFSGTRTHHHLSAAMAAAGFTDLSVKAWNYGSGFPKSLNVGKAIDKAAGAERKVLSQKPAYGIGASGPTFNGHSEGALATITAPATEAAKQWNGWGTALKPAWEPIIVGRKP